MNKLILILVICFFNSNVSSQECSRYDEFMKKAQSLWEKGEFEKSLNQLSLVREYCPPKSSEVDAQFVIFMKEISAKYKEADDQRKISEIREKETNKQKLISDSLYIESEKSKNELLLALERYRTMQDSAANATKQSQAATEKVVTLIKINDLEELGNIQIRKDSFARALYFFEEALAKMETLSTLDSSLLLKKLMLTQKHVETLISLEKQIKYFQLIALGDSLLNLNLGVQSIPGAYSAYLEAFALNYQNDTSSVRIANIEKKYFSNLRKIRRLPFEEFRSLIVMSGQGNFILNNVTQSKLRVRQAIQRFRPPYNYSFSHPDFSFKSLFLNNYAKQFNNNFMRKISLEVGLRDFLPIKMGSIEPYFNNSPSHKEDIYISDRFIGFSIGMNYSISNRFEVGFSISKFRPKIYNDGLWTSAAYPNINYSFEFNCETCQIVQGGVYNISEINLFSYYNIFRKSLKSKYPFRIQGLLGFSFISIPYIELNFIADDVPDIYIKSPLNTYGYKVPSINQNGSLDLSLYQTYNNGDPVYSLYIDGITIPTNYLSTGFRFSFSLFRRFQNLGFYFEFFKKTPLNAKRTDHINLAKSSKEYLEKFQSVNPEYIVLDFSDILDTYWDFDLNIETSGPRKFIDGWNLGIGTTFQF